MALLTRSEFERKLVATNLVASRGKAQRVASYIQTNLQGRSIEAYYALVPGIMNDGLAPSFSAAKTIVVLARDWLGA